MIVPGTRRRAPHLPHAFVTFALAVGAIAATLLGWVLIAPSNVGHEVPLAGPDISTVRSLAYTIPGPRFDDLVVHPVSGAGAPRVVASFPNGGLTNLHARGKASPHGDRIAVLWLPAFATRANLSVVDLSSGQTAQAEGVYDLLSELAWSPDGSAVAVNSTAEVEGVRRTSVIRIDAATLRAAPVATFENVLEAAPVGFSFDGRRLFVVVLDQRGSNLFAGRDGVFELVAELSPGRTRDWALSPDGARLAFVDILGAGSRTYVGRTLLIATGAITTLPSEKNQIGATWLPGSPVPVFGGPGGAWQLTDPAAADAYLVPRGWSPDGQFLVAAINPTRPEGSQPPAIELITTETSTAESTRFRISDAAGAAFMGWVRNPN